MNDRDRSGIVEEAARIVCVEELVDYGAAKRKAAERLGVPPHTPMPDNAAIQQAVIEYQRLFGGAEYRERLAQMRAAAVSALRLFARYTPRLVGAAVTGAVTASHRVQLHLFSESAEEVDIELLNRGVAFEQGERSYRYPNGREMPVPLLRLELAGIGIDAAVFPLDDLRRAPISPLDGKPFRRLDLAEAEQLAAP